MQILCYHFAKLFKVGRVYLVGSETSLRIVSTALEFAEVDINNISWVLWITPKLPIEILREPGLMVSLFLCDIAKKLYKLSDDFKNYLLRKASENDRTSTNDWIDALPTNIIIGFAHLQ